MRSPMLLSQSKTFLRPAQRLIRVGTSPLINSSLLGVLLEPFAARIRTLRSSFVK